MSDDREPILDAMLDELLGGDTPPDLREPILRAHEASQVAKREPSRDAIPNIVTRDPHRRQQRARPVRSRSWAGWTTVAIVVVGASLFLGWFVNQRQDFIARNQPPAQPSTPVTDNVTAPVPDSESEGPSKPEANGPPLPPLQGIDEVPVLEPSDPDHQVNPAFRRELALEPVWNDDRVVEFADRQLVASWRAADVDPVDEISDAEWYIRAHRFLLGQNPTRAAVQAFVRKDRDRGETVTELLERPEFAAQWASRLSDMLVGHIAPNQASLRRTQFEQYLRQAVADDKPYDALVFELITAVGSNDPERDDFNPAVNFLLAHQGIPASRGPQRQHQKIDATNIVCQIFLGKQMQCAQCHDHHDGHSSQEQYWQMASFFAQMREAPLANSASRLVNLDFAGRRGGLGDAELMYRRHDGNNDAAYPVFLDGRSPGSTSGMPSQLNRREALAKLIVSSDAFAKSAMNRFWGQVFGQGFTYPVDDMGDHNPASHPELLARLSNEFRNSGFSMRSAVRWMLLSAPFRLQASPNANLFNAYAKSTPPNSLAIAPAIAQLAQRRRGMSRLAQPADGQVSPEKVQEDYERLRLKTNNPLLDSSPGSPLAKIANNPRLQQKDKIDHLFLTILGRRPRARELNQSRSLMQQVGSTEEGLKDLGTILIRSREFAVQH